MTYIVITKGVEGCTIGPIKSKTEATECVDKQFLDGVYAATAYEVEGDELKEIYSRAIPKNL